MTQESYDSFWPKEDQEFFKNSHYMATAMLFIPVVDLLVRLFADYYSGEEYTSEKKQHRIKGFVVAVI
jgi:hypothetical protein